MTAETGQRAEIIEGLEPIQLDGSAGPRGRTAREYLNRARSMLYSEHLAGASGTAIVQRWTAVVDHVVRTLFETARTAYRERSTTLDQKCALIAQGGYGRGELNPWSDVDLLFLYPQRSDAYVETVTESVLYALWDSGLTVGQAMRSLRDCVSLAGGDFKVKTSLLDTRLLAGDAELYDTFASTIESEVLKRNAARFYREKVAENRERHRKHGDAVFLVEPHLKEGEGGLRDIHTATWLAKVKYRVHSLDELVVKGILTQGELDEVLGARDFLFRVRNALHFLSGGHQDHLTFEFQQRIAADLGYADDAQSRGVEKFMREYYLFAGVVNRFAEEMIERCVESRGPSHWVGRLASREIRPGVRIVADELVVADDAMFDRDPSMLLRLFADAQRHSVVFNAATRRIVRAKAQNLAHDDARCAPEAARAFLDILTWRHGVHDTLAMMHKLDVLGAYLPEFEYLRCMAQYDRYHIYTVDEHTLRAVQNVELMRNGAMKAEHPLLTSVAREIDNVEILYLGMMYHDIGKGRGGDHSNKGADMAVATARRMGLNDDATEQFAFLVRHHLTMHHLATRRDIHEPNLVMDFAALVGTLDNLKKLYVLTYADLKATNPKLWNSWQAMLLGELYELTVATFERGIMVEENQEQRAARVRERVLAAAAPEVRPGLSAYLREVPDRYVLSTPEAEIPRHFSLAEKLDASQGSLASQVEHFPEREFSEFTVVTKNRPGLFAKLTGVLRVKGLNVIGARATTAGHGLAIDVFRISHQEGAGDVATSRDQWERVSSMIRDVLEGRTDIEAIVDKAARPPIDRERFAPRVQPRVSVDNSISEDFTFVEVIATDRLGILHSVTREMFRLGLRIHLAKITTNVDRVLDVFYVTDDRDQKVPDPMLADIRTALLEVLQPPGDSPDESREAAVG